MSNEHKQVYGIAAEFESAAALYHAAEKVRDKGFKRWDVHSPYPIHGMDKAMGLGKSWLSAIVLCGGTTGFLTAVTLEFYAGLWGTPVIVHGKPVSFFTVPAFFPVMFELTVLFSALSCVIGLLILNMLPRWNHPMFNWDRFGKATDNGFFLVIEAADPKFSENSIREFLGELGGQHVTLVHE